MLFWWCKVTATYCLYNKLLCTSWSRFSFYKDIHASKEWNEPAHEIMALFVLHKLILQMRMRNHPMGLDVWFLVGAFVYFHTPCVRTAKALGRPRGCAGSPAPSLVAYVISTIISWVDSNKVNELWIYSWVILLLQIKVHFLNLLTVQKCIFERVPLLYVQSNYFSAATTST